MLVGSGTGTRLSSLYGHNRGEEEERGRMTEEGKKKRRERPSKRPE